MYHHDIKNGQSFHYVTVTAKFGFPCIGCLPVIFSFIYVWNWYTLCISVSKERFTLMMHTRRYVGIMLIVACFLYIFIGNMDVYINVYTMMIPRYSVLIIVLLTGYLSEKIEILPMLYFRYKSASAYFRKISMVRCKRYLYLAFIMNSSVLRFHSIYFFVSYMLIDTGVFMIIDDLCRILGMICKHKIDGYILFFILFISLEFLMENLNISQFFSEIWILPTCYPIEIFIGIILMFNIFLYFTNQHLIKHVDKINSVFHS